MKKDKKSMVNLSNIFAISKRLDSVANDINVSFKEIKNNRSSNLEAYINNCISLSSYDVDDNLIDSSNGVLGYYNNVLCLTIANINLTSILSNLGINYNQISSIILELEGSYSPFYGEIDIYDSNNDYFDTIDCTDGHNPLEIDIKAIYEQANDASFVLIPIIPCSGATYFITANAYLRISYQSSISFLSIEQAPNKTVYFEGETFDPTGMVIKLHYNDGSSEIITNYNYSPNSSLTISNTYITISYQQLSINQPITVNPIVLESISIQNPPYKVEYVEGDEFEIYGLILKANYNNGSSVVVNDYTFSPNRPLLNSDNQITFTYNNKSVNQSIVVNNPFSTGYFPIINNLKASIGSNPILNLNDLSSRFISESFSVNRDSYLLSFYLIYVSNLKDKLSRLMKGLPKRFKTNYHQFLIQDGIDDNNNPIYKYIDAESYIHSFYQINDSLFYSYQSNLFLSVDVNQDDENIYTITDENKNKLIFNDSGFLYQIVNGYDNSNIKELSYDENGYLLEVKDTRDISSKLSFIYQNNRLISIVFNYKNQTIKSLSISYDSGGLLTDVTELANSSFKNLYSFIYNSFSRINYSSYDRVEYIKDHINCVAYHIESLGFNSILKEYTISKIESGYFDNGNHFVSKDSASVGIFNVRTDDFKTINEVRIRDKNNIVTSYSVDKLANITAIFEHTNSGYKTLYKESGVYQSVDNSNGTNTYINTHQLMNVNEPFVFSLNNETISLLNDYYHFVLRLYLKLNSSTSKHVRAFLTGNNISSYSVDINVDQYQRYQLIEIPFSKTTNHISSLLLNLSFKDENNQNVNVDIGNIYVDKANKTNLYFNNGNLVFNDIESISLFASNSPAYFTFYNNGPLYLKEIDLINTLKRIRSHGDIYGDYLNDNLGSIIFVNNNQSFKRFKFAFAGYSTNSNFVNYHLGNSSLDDFNAWFIETVSFDNKSKTRTYYRFNVNDYEVIKRNYAKNDSNGEYVLVLSLINKYNYQEKLLQTTEIKLVDENDSSTVITTYNYFNNGELRNAVKSDGNESIVLYEANQNNDGYISRRTSGLQSVDISYNNYLEHIITKNTFNGSSITNSLYKKQISYDNYLQDISSVAYKYNNENRGTNNISQNGLTSTLSINNNPLYQLSYDETNNTSTFKRYNGSSYDNVVSIKQNDSINEVTYFDNSSNTVITNDYDEHRRIINQKVNNEIKVTFNYQSNWESPSIANLTSINDGYISKTISYSYNSIDNSISQINFNSGEFKIENGTNFIKQTFNNSHLPCVQYSDEEWRFVITIGEGDAAPFYFFHSKNDAYSRLIKTYCTINHLQWLISNQTYNQDSFLPSHFVFGTSTTNHDIIYDAVYSESYSYDCLGNLSSIGINNSLIQYSYDGFGRLVNEINPFANDFSRTYSYDNQGRMSAFGNKQLSYNGKGQLEYFDNIQFAYDTYGNRIRKGNIEYEYERGHLLKSVKLSATQTISFTYDYLGKRYQKLINNVVVSTYYYDGNNLVGERKNNGDEIRYLYDKTGLAGFCLYKSNVDFSTFIYIKNSFGQIIGIVSSYGDIVVRYVYDAWGNHQTIDYSGSLGLGAINPFRYKGYYYDQEIGLYFLMSRYYDPSVGQFISPDDFDYLNINNITGYHLYAYCNNNPVMSYDETGHEAFLALIGIALAVVFIVVPTIRDIGNFDKLNIVSTNEGVRIENSNLIKTPWTQWIYSFYLNHINKKTKNIIRGSTRGLQFEWMLHNIAFDVFGLENGEHLDTQKTIFTDHKHEWLGFAMKVGYIFTHPPFWWIFDLIVGGWKNDWE